VPESSVADLAAPLDETAVAFAEALRARGVAVPTDAVVTFARALAAAGTTPTGAYWAGRATLVRRPEDVAAYDQAFAEVLGGLRRADVHAVPRPVEVLLDADADDEPGGDDGSADDEVPDPDVRTVRWSAVEVLRRRDLAACTPDELRQAYRLMADLRIVAPRRTSRRRRPAPPGRGDLDLRRTVRRSLHTGGEVLRHPTTTTGDRPRRLVLLLDVSGSMEPYARGLARFAHAAVAGRRRGQVEVFALGTRVTRITRELSTHDPDAALRRAGDAVADWAGGTRLGDGLRRFNDRWGVRGIGRGATVVILSDGWDRGDPRALGDELARLGRVAHRIVWVNPLKGSPGYAPLAGGMAAALPYVDEFVEGHSVASLEALAEVVSRG
jgi:uncharacterized protein with von Willebrand factor type A (vWA) domain